MSRERPMRTNFRRPALAGLFVVALLIGGGGT
jgi:hypothetical protein